MQDISDLNVGVNGINIRCRARRFLTLLFLAFTLKELCILKVENYRLKKRNNCMITVTYFFVFVQIILN